MPCEDEENLNRIIAHMNKTVKDIRDAIPVDNYGKPIVNTKTIEERLHGEGEAGYEPGTIGYKLERGMYYYTRPLECMISYTTPDVNKPEHRHKFWITICMSCVW